MPSFRGEVVSFKDVTVLKATENALLCAIDGKEVWIPQSQIDDDSEVFAEDTEGELVISEWIAKEKNLV